MPELFIDVTVKDLAGFGFHSDHVPAVGDTIFHYATQRTLIVTGREWDIQDRKVEAVYLQAVLKLDTVS